MKGVVIYSSKYGATKQYAQWLSEELKLDLLDAKQLKKEDLVNYDLIVFGTSVYAGRFGITKLVKSSWDMLATKKKFLLVVGMTDPQKTVDIETMLKVNFSDEYLKQMPWYYLRGKLDIGSLGFFYRMLMKMMASMVKDEQEKIILQQGMDDVKREYLTPVVKGIRECTGEQV